jgi:hypothetical protein
VVVGVGFVLPAGNMCEKLLVDLCARNLAFFLFDALPNGRDHEKKDRSARDIQ